MKKIEIYTDGACSGNPGPGGWGVVLLYQGNICIVKSFLNSYFIKPLLNIKNDNK